MALHRDIFWLGRQWAVTGYGIQAVNKKLEGKFDVDVSRLWEEGLTEPMLSESWFDLDDFKEALEVARKRSREAPVVFDRPNRRRNETPWVPWMTRAIRSTGTLELAGRVACCDGAFQAGFTDIDTLAEPFRIVIRVALRNAHAFLLSVSGLLLRTRRDADCYR
jgi:hypothetical protein